MNETNDNINQLFDNKFKKANQYIGAITQYLTTQPKTINIDATANDDIKDAPIKTLQHIIRVNNTQINDITKMRYTENESPTKANVNVSNQGA